MKSEGLEVLISGEKEIPVNCLERNSELCYKLLWQVTGS